MQPTMCLVSRRSETRVKAMRSHLGANVCDGDLSRTQLEDLTSLLELVQKRVARSTTIMLAVAGNALKAFPGLGTLDGGITHAAAYGMIFDALGKAVALSLGVPGLRPARAAQVFEESLSEDLEARARRFA